MAWIKSHQSLERHPKVLALESHAKIDHNTAIGVLHRFWYWVIDYAEDGRLLRWPIATISSAIGIDAQHLISAGWIDEKPELRVHDWFDYFGEYFRGKYRKNPERYEQLKSYYSKSGTGLVPVQYRFGTGQIRGDKIREDKDKDRRFVKPSAESVASYAKTLGFELNPEEFLAHYEANGWFRGKTKVRDWRACVRTWKVRRESDKQISEKEKSWEQTT